MPVDVLVQTCVNGNSSAHVYDLRPLISWISAFIS
jgi:hypothetical protein